jgi:cell division protein FtsQ
VQSLARRPAADGLAVDRASAGRFVLPRLLRRPFRLVQRTVNEGIAFSPRRVALAGIVIVAGATAAGVVTGGHVGDVLSRVSVLAGFRVGDIEINGTREVSRIDVLTNIDLGPDRSLFAFDVHKARDDLKRLSWIRDVSVSKAYPDKLVINVIERDPYAIWQNGQALYVVGRDGTEIEPFEERFASLPLVVGKGAASHAADLIAAVDRYPELAGKVKAYIRVGDRRWNLQFDDGVTVLLPEFNVTGGLTELARLAREEAIFSRAIEAVDLRLPDRTVVRLTPGAAQSRRDEIRERIKRASVRGNNT